jgi:peptide/nickel transport system permease protein
MISFLLRRAGWSLVVLFLVATATFFLPFLSPVDPAKLIAGAHASNEVVQKIREEKGLDQPVVVQYGRYMGKLLLEGDLGISYQSNRAVGEVLSQGLGNTLYLAAGAMIFQLLFGVPIGLYSALRAGRPADLAAMSLALLGISAPTFLVGLGLMFVFGFTYGFFPLGGGGDGFWDTLHHAILPAATLGFSGAAYYSRLTRGEYLEAASQDYMRTARAKGLPESTVVLKHGLRNALLPLVTFAGLDFGVMLGGAIVTERIFAWPGLGRCGV